MLGTVDLGESDKVSKWDITHLKVKFGSDFNMQMSLYKNLIAHSYKWMYANYIGHSI